MVAASQGNSTRGSAGLSGIQAGYKPLTVLLGAQPPGHLLAFNLGACIRLLVEVTVAVRGLFQFGALA